MFLKQIEASDENFKFEYRNLNLKEQEQKQDWFLRINSSGQVPAIEDTETGFTLGESKAILFYLAERFMKNTDWWPEDLEKRCKIQHLFLLSIDMYNTVGPSAAAKFMFGRQVRQVSWDQLGAMITCVDSHYENSWDEKLTIADLMIYSICALALDTPTFFDWINYESLIKMAKAVRALPGFDDVHAYYKKWIQSKIL